MTERTRATFQQRPRNECWRIVSFGTPRSSLIQEIAIDPDSLHLTGSTFDISPCGQQPLSPVNKIHVSNFRFEGCPREFYCRLSGDLRPDAGGLSLHIYGHFNFNILCALNVGCITLFVLNRPFVLSLWWLWKIPAGLQYSGKLMARRVQLL